MDSAQMVESGKGHEQPGLESKTKPTPETINPEYRGSSKLEGKVALITGGDSGIGKSVAYHFAKEGASVAFTFLPPMEEEDAQNTLQMLRETQQPGAQEPLSLGADLGDAENCKSIIDKVIQHFGRIDILVNNCAEEHESKRLEDVGNDEWERTFRTNIFSYFYMCKYALPHMKEGSAIINTSSVNAYKGHATLLPYTTTKGAIVAFTRSLAMQIVDRKIRVNGVAPGPIWTPLIPSTSAVEKLESFGKSVPMGRPGQPREVAPSYVFLASEDSSYISGQFLHPNGGMVINA